MVGYMQAQPAVSIRALLVDRVVNMIDEGVDVAVRIGDLPDTGMESVGVGRVRRVVCGSPDYLARMGTPSRPEQLSDHRCALSNSNPMSAQFFERGQPLSVHLQPQLLTSTMQAAINAACNGWGLTRVLSYQIATQLADGSLKCVLEAFEPPPLPINIVCQNPGKQTARVRGFVDYCVDELRRNPALNSINVG
jgi:DNA-binding transcriptional LysR family regulator